MRYGGRVAAILALLMDMIFLEAYEFARAGER